MLKVGTETIAKVSRNLLLKKADVGLKSIFYLFTEESYLQFDTTSLNGPPDVTSWVLGGMIALKKIPLRTKGFLINRNIYWIERYKRANKQKKKKKSVCLVLLGVLKALFDQGIEN